MSQHKQLPDPTTAWSRVRGQKEDRRSVGGKRPHLTLVSQAVNGVVARTWARARLALGCRSSTRHATPNTENRTRFTMSLSGSHQVSAWRNMELDLKSQLSSELTRIIECPYPASLSVSVGSIAHHF